MACVRTSLLFRLNTIPSDAYTIFCLSIHLLMDAWVFCSFWLFPQSYFDRWFTLGLQCIPFPFSHLFNFNLNVASQKKSCTTLSKVRSCLSDVLADLYKPLFGCVSHCLVSVFNSSPPSLGWAHRSSGVSYCPLRFHHPALREWLSIRVCRTSQAYLELHAPPEGSPLQEWYM